MDKNIYTLGKDNKFGPFLTLRVRNGPSVSFRTIFPCINNHEENVVTGSGLHG